MAVIKIPNGSGGWVKFPTIKGDKGDTGNGISSVVKTSGTGAAGTTDTYTITFTNGTTTTFQVYNGADGLGSGDMLKSIYDTNNDGKVNRADDADKLGGQLPGYYAKVEDIPDISGKLDNSHNTDTAAHADIRESINSLDANKVDNSRVLTDVPVNAKFTDTVYTHPTTAGNKHIPAGGATNQYLKYSASGTAVWSDLGDAPSVNGKSIWVGAEESRGTDANTIYFCY
jgi:hypothetical protein